MGCKAGNSRRLGSPFTQRFFIRCSPPMNSLYTAASAPSPSSSAVISPWASHSSRGCASFTSFHLAKATIGASFPPSASLPSARSSATMTMTSADASAALSAGGNIPPANLARASSVTPPGCISLFMTPGPKASKWIFAIAPASAGVARRMRSRGAGAPVDDMMARPGYWGDGLG